MKKIIILGIAVILAIIALYNLSHNSSRENDKVVIVSIGEREFLAEVASSKEKRAKGLGGRESLCEDCAMLFEFPEAGNYPFWMKDMQFAIDMIRINGDEIVYIAKGVSQHYRGIVDPQKEADKVLEINAGLSDKYGFKNGDKIIIE